jgi:hypothetical protein
MLSCGIPNTISAKATVAVCRSSLILRNMLKQLYLTITSIIAIGLLAACQPEVTVSGPPTAIPFPTMTVGSAVRGDLELANMRQGPDAADSPATAVARVSRPTPTPNLAACPAVLEGVTLADQPSTRQAAIDAILGYLNTGGDLPTLRAALRVDWEALGETGYVRGDVDLTGEGEPEVVIGMTAPGDVGIALLLVCESGRYSPRIELVADGLEPPRLTWLGDINNDNLPEAVLSRRICADAEACEFETLVLSWSESVGRLVNLLDDRLISLQPPTLRDTDNDDVSELVINLDTRGTSATGPLRTGINIYDWNGSVYTLSIIQLDAPQYRIQFVHQGDAEFSRQNVDAAANLYRQALDADGLRYWFNDGPTVVTSYAIYRLMLATAYGGEERAESYANALARLRAAFPPDTADNLPIYARMAYTFGNTLSETGDLHRACVAVQNIVAQDENADALALLNRYGSRSPTYTPLMLCPY